MLNRYQQLQQLDGVVYRQQPGRKTFATRIDDRPCFVKLHAGVGWCEIFKNLVQGRLPIVGATPEYRALTRLASLNIPSLEVVEYGRCGLNPATQRSYLVTKALINTLSLEDFCAKWRTDPPSIVFKRRLIRAVAELTARLHAAGINHRDCYLCHFHLDMTALEQGRIELSLIDLHRAQIRTHVPWRWRIKDLAGLYFSAMRLGLNWRDYLWFVRCYAYDLTPGQTYPFWDAVERRAYHLLLKTHYQKHVSFKHSCLLDRGIPGLPQDAWACDRLIDTATILKDDATTTVAKVLSTSLLIKRYNVRSLGKAMKRWFKPSRAYKAFLAAVRLVELGIATPQPLAYYEKRWGCFKHESYLLTEYVIGDDIGHSFATYSPTQQKAVLTYFQRFLRTLALLRTSHGDMKATNFLWAQHVLYALDLDACRHWSSRSGHRRALFKDRARFAKNVLNSKIKGV